METDVTSFIVKVRESESYLWVPRSVTLSPLTDLQRDGTGVLSNNPPSTLVSSSGLVFVFTVSP